MKFQLKYKLIQVLALTSLIISSSIISSSAAFAASEEICLNDVTAVSTNAAKFEGVEVGDLAVFMQAQPIIDGGVIHPPLRDQKFAEICWSYALNEFTDTLSLRDTGQLKVSSADHNGFWHFYFQIFEHGSYFTKLAAKVKANKVSLDDAVAEAVKMLHSRPTSMTARAAGFTVDSGSDEPIALFEARTIGFVPNELFDRPITSLAQANSLTTALKGLVKSVLTDPAKDTFFGAKDPDGINSPLYNLMTNKLQDFMKGSSANNHLPYRPNDTFIYNGAQYTPLEFMTKVLNFNPDDYVMVTTTNQNKDLLYQAIHESLTAPKPVPVLMGWAVFNQKKGEQDMVWSTDLLAEGPVTMDGGHEVMIVNAKHDGVNIVGWIFQNTWGPQGLDVNGAKPQTPAQSGFNGMTLGYNNVATQQKEASEFIFPKAFLQQAQYASLLTDAVGPVEDLKPSHR